MSVAVGRADGGLGARAPTWTAPPPTPSPARCSRRRTAARR